MHHTVTLRSPHRSAPLILPTSSETAAAYVLEIINTSSDSVCVSSAIEGMALRLETICNASSEQLEREMGAQAALLNALFVKNMGESALASSPDIKAKFAKTAIHLHTAYLKTASVITVMKDVRARSEKKIDFIGMEAFD